MNAAISAAALATLRSKRNRPVTSVIHTETNAAIIISSGNLQFCWPTHSRRVPNAASVAMLI